MSRFGSATLCVCFLAGLTASCRPPVAANQGTTVASFRSDSTVRPVRKLPSDFKKSETSDCNALLIQDSVKFKGSTFDKLYYNYLLAKHRQSSGDSSFGVMIPIDGVPVGLDSAQSDQISQSLVSNVTSTFEGSSKTDYSYNYLSKDVLGTYQKCRHDEGGETSIEISPAWQEQPSPNGESKPADDRVVVNYSLFYRVEEFGGTVPKLKSLTLTDFDGVPISNGSDGKLLHKGSPLSPVYEGKLYVPLQFKPTTNQTFSVQIEAVLTMPGQADRKVSAVAFAQRPPKIVATFPEFDRGPTDIFATYMGFGSPGQHVANQTYPSPRVALSPGPQDGSDSWARSAYVIKDRDLNHICHPYVQNGQMTDSTRQTCAYAKDPATGAPNYSLIDAGYDQSYGGLPNYGGGTVLKVAWTDIYPVLRIGNHSVSDVPREVICKLGLDNKPLGWSQSGPIC